MTTCTSRIIYYTAKEREANKRIVAKQVRQQIRKEEQKGKTK